MGLIQNNISLQNITDIITLSTGDPVEMMINSNAIIYGGWFFFIMLCLLGFILFRKAQAKDDNPMVNVMYIATALTIVSFFLRAIYVVKMGVVAGLLTDFQMWIFPLVAALSATIIKFTNPN